MKRLALLLFVVWNVSVYTAAEMPHHNPEALFFKKMASLIKTLATTSSTSPFHIKGMNITDRALITLSLSQGFKKSMPLLGSLLIDLHPAKIHKPLKKLWNSLFLHKTHAERAAFIDQLEQRQATTKKPLITLFLSLWYHLNAVCDVFHQEAFYRLKSAYYYEKKNQLAPTMIQQPRGGVFPILWPLHLVYSSQSGIRSLSEECKAIYSYFDEYRNNSWSDSRKHWGGNHFISSTLQPYSLEEQEELIKEYFYKEDPLPEHFLPHEVVELFITTYRTTYETERTEKSLVEAQQQALIAANKTCKAYVPQLVLSLSQRQEAPLRPAQAFGAIVAEQQCIMLTPELHTLLVEEPLTPEMVTRLNTQFSSQLLSHCQFFIMMQFLSLAIHPLEMERTAHHFSAETADAPSAL